MSFSSMVAGMDRAVLGVFGATDSNNAPLLLTIHPQSGTTTGASDYALTVVTRNPAMEEDYLPGSTQGVTELNLFIRFASLSTPPHEGDTATWAGVDYDVMKVQADREGGAALRLRRRSQPWNA